ncbi:polysaccharide lyase family 8 super-sandwich domain-containing protein [Chitinophaga sp. XS-30]|uniref:polysaccharide lyase family 8 super-sandwich domain-containing protein n=1 Tax=Chitinophaga sp. XS-30 TaxID=2604421 RepID=UPI0011DDA6AA|nr:polysaccharide lyase family 8 super-sandwich domain-containing protein [Chitinophaga sp. XS-30]QEH43022.1 DNRLRE domain-containing protein [Chitinophaga sp. XS-30]
MKRTLLVLSCLFLCMMPSRAQTEYHTIMERIRTDQLAMVSNVTTLDNGVTSTLATLQTNGSWPDVNYTYSSTTYTANVHLTRVKNFVLAYSHTASTHYHSTTLFNAISSSLGYWDTADPQSWNWYHNQISNPQMLGEILILLEAAPLSLSTTLRSNLLSQMNRGNPAAQTGANKLDVATHFIYRACLTADSVLMQTGVSEAFYPISLTTQEGMQHDLSYQQHGPQLYMFGYGFVFVGGEVKIAYYLRGTSYALSGSQLSLFSDFVRNAYLKVMRGRYIDFSVNGRSISRVNNMGQSGVASQLTKLKALDTAYTAAYDQAIARIQNSQPPSYMITPTHTHFWRSDYTVHHRPGYFFGLRNVSTRTSKSENGNGENLKGYYLSEGATNIAVSGSEYLNIFPVWDWARIPGTTTPYITTFPLRAAWGGNYGTSTFSGGVSDSLYGVTALAFSDYNTQARKAWFFFDNEIVCLGANINSTAAQAINTTVNQCLLSGNVTVSANGTESTLSMGAHSYNNNLKWVSHNGIGYYFPAGGNIQLSNQARTGTWSSINNGGATTTQNMNVFTLWFDHGVQPANGSYAYYVLPGQHMPSYDTTAVRVLQNDADIQAVRHTGLNNWQLAFYKAGTFSQDSVTITADRPCALMLKQVGSTSVTVSVADPSQSSLPVNLYLNLPGIPQTRHLACTLPSGPTAGSTATFQVNLSTPVYQPSLVTAIADAYVRNGSYAGTNYGSVTSLVIKKDTEGYAREVYLKFNITDIPSTTDNVKLRLYVPYANTGIAAVPWILQYVSNDSWTESGINWNNKPIGTSAIDTVTGRPAGNYAEWDVTAIALSQQLADGILSLRVISDATGSTTDASFSSRETANTDFRPVLVCTSGSSFLSSLPAVKSAASSAVSIYPNPTQGSVRVETDKLYRRAAVLDISGRLISLEELGGRKRFELDLRHVKPGVYTLQLSGDGEPVVKKIVKL